MYNSHELFHSNGLVTCRGSHAIQTYSTYVRMYTLQGKDPCMGHRGQSLSFPSDGGIDNTFPDQPFADLFVTN